MKTVLTLSAALVIALALPAAGARAAPFAPLGAAADSNVILVAGGCGVGWHRGPFGGCRRNLSPAWPCYWVRGPYGRWRLICR